MKRALSLFLSVLMLTSVVAAVDLSAYAATVDSGTCGDNLTWVLDEDGTLTISGTGDMKDDSFSSAPWNSSSSSVSVENVVINSGVTSIGTYAFYHCKDLTSITIPNTVTSIGNWAFYYCSSLTSITIPDSVTSIGEDAFRYCTGLTCVTIGNGVASIGEYAFTFCSSLTSITVDSNNKCFSSESGVLFDKNKTELICYPVCKTDSSYTIPSSVKSINDNAFERCQNLTSVIIPNGVTSIGDSAFSDCDSLTNITIPDSVTSIGKDAFASCYSLTSITIPNSVTEIGESAFWCCDSLTSITIPDGVTSIENETFYHCSSLASITIPGSVTSIGWYAFFNCGLTDIYYSGAQDEWNNIDIDSSNKVLLDVTIHFSDGKTGKTIMKGTCGDNLTWELENGTLTVCGTGDMKRYSYDEADDDNRPSPPWSSYKSYIKYVVINDGVTSIGSEAFEDCGNVKYVTLGKNVTIVDTSAFRACSNLTSITIPVSVTSIKNWAFSGCNITDIYYSGSESDWNEIDIGSKNDILTSATIHYNSTVNAVEEGKKADAKEETSSSDSTSDSTSGSTSGSTSSGSSSSDSTGSTTTECSTHTWDSGKTTTKATCTKAGVKTYTCKVCGATKTESIAKTAHTWKVSTKASATNKKSGKFKCTVCGATKKLYYPKSFSVTTSYSYNGKARKPSVTVKDSNGSKISSKYYTVSYINQSTGKTVSSIKNPGKYYVKVKMKSSSRYKSYTFKKKTITVKPKKTSIKSIKASSKGFTVKWSKVSTQNTGYQIQYSTSKSFKKAKTATVKKTGTTSKKVTKLKAKKKYYVRVRTYKTVKVNGKSTKIYSAWSSTKGVTTKK